MTEERLEQIADHLDRVEMHEEGYDWAMNQGSELVNACLELLKENADLKAAQVQ